MKVFNYLCRPLEKAITKMAFAMKILTSIMDAPIAVVVSVDGACLVWADMNWEYHAYYSAQLQSIHTN